MTKDEALKLALEALETLDVGDSYKTHNAASALRRALEQPEPFEYWNAVEGWVTVDADEVIDGKAAQKMKQAAMKAVDPQYRDDPEVMFALGWDAGFQARTRRACADCNGMGFVDGVGERCQKCAGEGVEQPEQEPDCNPHPDAPHGFNRDASHNLGRYVCECEGWDPPEQEPVAWLDTFTDEVYSNSELDEEAKKDLAPIYTAPPKREWQGLTDEEIFDLADHYGEFKYGDAQGHKRLEFARAIEAKLKEKNT